MKCPNCGYDTKAITAQETAVWKVLTEGGSDKEIATELGIAVRTVSCHMLNLRRKLGMSQASRVNMARLAIERGIVEAPVRPELGEI